MHLIFDQQSIYPRKNIKKKKYKEKSVTMNTNSEYSANDENIREDYY